MGSWSTDLTEGSCVVYECPRCLHHMWLLDDTLDTLRVYLSDPTIGYPELDLLCAKCQHVGSCCQIVVPRFLRGQAFQDLRDRKVGWLPAKCAKENCGFHRKSRGTVSKLGAADYG
jgi:hypothetical protein